MRLDELNSLTEDPNLWDNPANAQKLLSERNYLEQMIGKSKDLENNLSEALLLIEMAEEEGDEASAQEAEAIIHDIADELKKLELDSLLSGEADKNNCFIEINSGAGGTESQDWAEMLLRMYMRWAERRGYKTELISENSGEVAGIKSATIKINGHNAYGYAKTESGVHRLVRISPFDSNARRHTSFASIWVYPEVDDDITIEIDDKDIRVDTFRASGAGGQHVNKTDSAVRMTHTPTGIVTQSQNSRSQHKNREEAMKMMKARLYELELRKREEALQSEHDSKGDNSWGSQIRSYVLHPYQMVKDLRTAHETSNTSAVLDGDLDDFISASLASRLGDEV